MRRRSAGIRPVLAAAFILLSGCATDPFAWKDDRPVPRDLVRQHLLRGSSRVLAAPYAEIYRAAARSLDASAYYSVSRDWRAIYADDFHGMSSAGVFFHPTEGEDRTMVEVLYLTEGSSSAGPGRRQEAERSLLDEIEQTLRGGSSSPAPSAARGAANSTIDSVAGLPLRRRPRDFAVIVGAEGHAWLGVADYALRDAEIFRKYAETVLGVAPDRVIFLVNENAKRADLLSALDRAGRETGRESRVWFFFAGHGGVDAASGIPYLVSWDSDPRYWSATTLPLAELFRALQAIASSEVVAVLDASFSGFGGRTWNETAYRPFLQEKRPAASVSRLSVLYAAGPGEAARVLDDQAHGLFFHVLLPARPAGRGDDGPPSAPGGRRALLVPPGPRALAEPRRGAESASGDHHGGHASMVKSFR